MSKSALVLIADGSEEMEGIISIDVLRRANVNVTVASVMRSDIVTCSRNVIVKADTNLQSVKDKLFDVVVLPGGLGGANQFAKNSTVGEVLQSHQTAGNFIAAICAAPTVLQAHGIAKGKRITSYPSVREKLEGDYVYSEDRVLRDGNIITSRSPGTAFEFAFEIVNALFGADCVKKLSEEMLCK
ncbi:protein dj-1beta-like [Clytia hemisphaerica]|uniref:protein dj-1beta-like n=1 Tax=Clytia hemisphaerica TaxID=252671 RepID=UPI0034D64C4A